MAKPCISVFTPTHDPTYLADCYRSLRLQTYGGWEWVIVPNGGVDAESIPADIRDDSRVAVIKGPDTGKIGELKRFACEQAKGDAFLELDHDDMLTPNALADAAGRLQAGAGFVYSDAAVFDEHGHSFAYSDEFGWDRYIVRVYGQPYLASKTFDVTPRALCDIYFSPDHFRCWSRDAYESVGGHDKNLSVGDDHDLICRTYINGEKFAYTGSCGYLYRMYDSNSFKLKNKELQQTVVSNRRKYLTNLITEWRFRHGYERLDLRELYEQDAWDCKPLATDGVKYGHIVVDDVLQYCQPSDIVKVMDSLYESLVPGGYLTVTVPDSAKGFGADFDPRHLLRFNTNSMLHYTHRHFAERMKPKPTCRFQLIDSYNPVPSPLYRELSMLSLRFELMALTDQERQPGMKYI